MIPRKKTLEGLYGDKSWFKQEMSLNDDWEFEFNWRQVVTLTALGLVELGVVIGIIYFIFKSF